LGQGVVAEVHRPDELVLTIEYHDISVGNVPSVPDILGAIVLHQRKRDILHGGVYARAVADFVDRMQLYGEFGKLRFKLFLELIEVAKLAPAEASRCVDEVPTTYFLEVIPRRDDLLVGGRIGVLVGQGKVGCNAVTEAAPTRRAAHNQQACADNKRVPR
jgi:hypothetical protein